MPCTLFRSRTSRAENRRPLSTKKPEFDYNQALRRLIYFVLLGCAYILIYALCSWRNGLSLDFCILSVTPTRKFVRTCTGLEP